MGGIGIIFNPLAGKNRKCRRMSQDLNDLVTEDCILKETKSINALHQAVLEFKEHDIDIIAISGGDGTSHLVLSAVVNSYQDKSLPKFICLRSGTMNTFSNSVKFKGNTQNILKESIDRYQKGKPFKEISQHLVKINDKYGFLTGAGVVSKFLETYYLSSNPGPLHASKMVFKIIFSTIFRTLYSKGMFSPTKINIAVDGKKIENNEYMFILGCTIKELGLGFTPTPRAYEKPGHFHFLASSMKPMSLVPKVPAIWLGNDFSHPELHYNDIAREVIVEPEGKLLWMVDGDLYSTEEPLHISVGPTIIAMSPY